MCLSVCACVCMCVCDGDKTTMVTKVVMMYLKEFANETNLTRHMKNFYRSHVQSRVDKFNIPRQSDVLYRDVSCDKYMHGCSVSSFAMLKTLTCYLYSRVFNVQGTALLAFDVMTAINRLACL